MYRILPFQFKRFSKNEVLIVNECGDYYFLDNYSFDTFVRHQLDENSEAFLDLKSKLFLAQDDFEVSLEKIAARYRTRKLFLREFTTLHMLVITLRCNQRCEYCQVSCAEQDAHSYDMSEDVAEKIVDMIFCAPTSHPKIEFQGGEPLLNWKVIEHTVKYAKSVAQKTNKQASFVICTNLIEISKEQLEFCREHDVAISTSLDGPVDIHDKCRKARIGDGTYRKFVDKLNLAREIVGFDGVDALMTTTAYSVNCLKDIIDEYALQGMGGIFIRSLNPYGFAAEQANILGYDMRSFVDNYLEALKYMADSTCKCNTLKVE